MPTAKLIPDGRGQIVCIPDEYRFDADEVRIVKRGTDLLLMPKPRNAHKSVKSVRTKTGTRSATRAK